MTSSVSLIETEQRRPRAGGDPAGHPRLSVRLVMFFTRGMSLDGWWRLGRFEREVMLYHALSSRLESIAFLTYGGREEWRFRDRLGEIAILPNQWRLDSNLYSLVAPLLHVRAMRQATVFKTNQLNGAWCAAIAKWVFRKPLIVRSGFVWSDFYARLTRSAWKRRLARAIERTVLRYADRIVVATATDKRHFVEQYQIDPAKIWITPNYVDTERFRPLPEVERESGLLCFVGNLGVNKNLPALLDAIQGIPGVRLLLVGDGTMRTDLERIVREQQLPVEFMGVVPNDCLPRILNRARLFLFPSLYEGHPKALLEAMACGLPVIVTNAPGNREVVVHRGTGYLCGTSAAEIRAAITEVLGDPTLSARMGANARAAIQAACSFERILERELAIFEEVAAEVPALLTSRQRGG